MGRHNDRVIGDAVRSIVADMLTPALGHDRMDAEEKIAEHEERIARLEAETARLRTLLEMALTTRAVGDNAPSKGS